MAKLPKRFIFSRPRFFQVISEEIDIYSAEQLLNAFRAVYQYADLDNFPHDEIKEIFEEHRSIFINLGGKVRWDDVTSVRQTLDVETCKDVDRIARLLAKKGGRKNVKSAKQVATTGSHDNLEIPSAVASASGFGNLDDDDLEFQCEASEELSRKMAADLRVKN